MLSRAGLIAAAQEMMQHQGQLGVVTVDVLHLQQLQAQHGHSVVEQLWHQISQRCEELSLSIRELCLVGQVAEHGLALAWAPQDGTAGGLPPELALRQLAVQLRSDLAAPFIIDAALSIPLSTCIGLAHAYQGHQTPVEVLLQAWTARC